MCCPCTHLLIESLSRIVLKTFCASGTIPAWGAYREQNRQNLSLMGSERRMGGWMDGWKDGWICRMVMRAEGGRPLFRGSEQASPRGRQWRRDLRRREQAMDLWDRHSRQKERDSYSGPEVGICLVVPGAARRPTEKTRADGK